MYAVVKTGGKQYRVAVGDRLKVESLKDAQEGDKVTLDQVLMIGDGDKIAVGTPMLDKTVEATVLSNGRVRNFASLNSVDVKTLAHVPDIGKTLPSSKLPLSVVKQRLKNRLLRKPRQRLNQKLSLKLAKRRLRKLSLRQMI